MGARERDRHETISTWIVLDGLYFSVCWFSCCICFLLIFIVSYFHLLQSTCLFPTPAEIRHIQQVTHKKYISCLPNAKQESADVILDLML